jgi:hypothetical protein
VIDPIILRDLCYEIESRQSTEENLENCADFLILPWGSISRKAGRRRKIGLLVGRQGQHIHAVQNKYNVCVRIIMQSGSKQMREQLTRILLSENETHTNDSLYLLLTKMDTSIKTKTLFDEVKQILTEKWNAIVQSRVTQQE